MIARTTTYPGFFSVSDLVLSSQELKILYRKQNLEELSSLTSLSLGIFAEIQYPIITGENIVRHQGSARYIGTTDQYSVAKKFCSTQKDCILHIDPGLFIGSFLIDVERTIKLVGTAFYTEFPEHEHVLPAIPLGAIRHIEYNNQLFPNPFYIRIDNTNKDKYLQLYELLLKTLQTLFHNGKEMTREERQDLLKEFFISYFAFYQAQLGNNNPYELTPTEFTKKWGHIFIGPLSTGDLSQDKTLKDIVLQNADALFLSNRVYSCLLSGERRDKIIEQDDGGYGLVRYSNTFD